MYPRPTSHNPALGPGCTGPSLAQYVPDCVDVSSRPTVQQPSSGAAPFMVDPKSVAAGLGGHDPTKHTTCVVLMCMMAPALEVYKFEASHQSILKAVVARDMKISAGFDARHNGTRLLLLCMEGTEDYPGDAGHPMSREPLF